MNITKKQLASLFFCSLVPSIVGNGLVPLLPIYATRLGADSAVAGFYLSFSYLAIALGALSAGWVSDGLRCQKRPLIIAGLVCVPTAWLMGQVNTVLGLTILTALLWFFGGLALALISILAGLSAGENERGKIFGVLALTVGLGSMIGGLGTGWLVDHWGYTVMFNVLTICLIFWPLSALLLEEKEGKQPEMEKAPHRTLPGLGKSFYLLFTASILFTIAGFFVVLIRSILMYNLKFNALEITSTGAIGGLMAMPFPLLMGWLSDRIDRKTFLFVGFLTALASLVLLAFSKSLWNFWFVFALLGISNGSYGIGNAFVTDLVPRESIGKGLAVYGSAGWIGGVIGFAVTGYAVQNLGLLPTFIVGGCLAVAALGLLVSIPAKSRNIRNSKTIYPLRGG